MQSHLFRIAALAAIVMIAAEETSLAQKYKEREGTPLPDYARAIQLSGERGPVDLADNDLPNIMVTGYWPPTNEMLRPFSNNAEQNPDGWIGEDWEGRGYNVYAFFPEFPEGLGKGEGDFEVDYQDTSADFWDIVAQVEPIAIITFGRADDDMDWELEGGARMYALSIWTDDYLAPFDPTPELPIASEPSGTERWSTLPFQEIIDAVVADVPTLTVYSTTIDTSRFLCNFLGYHACWYRVLHSDRSDPAWVAASGHVHVGSALSLAEASDAAEATIRTLTDHLDAWSLLPAEEPASPDNTPKNRYLSFVPGSNAVPVAYHVEMTSSAHFPTSTGSVGWVSEPDMDGFSTVEDTPFFSDAWPALVNVGDCEIVPAATYAIAVSADGIHLGEPAEFETVGQPTPKNWADVVGAFGGVTWSAPNGIVSMDDIMATLQGFQVLASAPPLTWVDLDGEIPNQVANMTDVMLAVQGFQGQAYPFSDPSACP